MSARRSTILIADPDWEDFGAVYSVTEGLDVELFWAANGEKALELLDRRPIDILISDWDVRVPDGRLICTAAKSMARDGPPHTILLTEDGQGGEVLGDAAGVDDLLRKPVNMLELRTRVHVALIVRDLTVHAAELERRVHMAGRVIQHLGPPLGSLVGYAGLLRQELRRPRLESRREDLQELAEALERLTQRLERTLAPLRELELPLDHPTDD
ncbi:hypothetical protein KQI84_18640 [bacterium]|nr:hypothetical protein [bacterium]